MKLFTSLLFVLTIGIIFYHTSVHSSLYSSSSGAPAGNTGSPGDGNNCNKCHSATPQTTQGLISSNIPGTGYVPGVKYTITAAIGGISKTRFGFQISPQNNAGQSLGNIVVTSTTETQKILGVGNVQYITHKSAGTSGNNSRTWTFDWTAPTSGTGTVTFYGAFIVANSNNQTSGDQIYLSSLAVNENTTSVDDINSDNTISLFPVPVNDVLNISVPAEYLGGYCIIYSISGTPVFNSKLHSLTTPIQVSDLAKGCYIIVLESNGQYLLKKFIKY